MGEKLDRIIALAAVALCVICVISISMVAPDLIQIFETQVSSLPSEGTSTALMSGACPQGPGSGGGGGGVT